MVLNDYSSGKFIQEQLTGGLENTSPTLQILYQDKFLVAINKPHDLLVHRTRIANDADTFALQLLRDQLDCPVYPAHRLDRKTGGVMLFALNPDILKMMQHAFASRKISKQYLAIVRGFAEPEGTVDYPLRKDNGVMQEAITHFQTLSKTEMNWPSGNFPSSRYSLVLLKPVTGRKHQLRKHMAHLLHPIIADRPYGCNKQNKLFKEKFGLMTMMLHAFRITFPHPETGEQISVEAPLHPEFVRMLNELNLPFHPDPHSTAS